MASAERGEVRNPTGKGGFGDRPQDINRAGRPRKGESLPDLLEKILDEDSGALKDGTKLEKREALCRKLIDIAFQGEAWAFKEVFDRKSGYALGKGPYEDVAYDDIEDKQDFALTHSRERYEWVRQLYNAEDEVKIGGPSYNWVKEAIEAGRRAISGADQIEIPVLLLQAGEDSIVTSSL